MAVTRYFTKVVKPILNPVVMESGAYTDDDVLFDYTPFDVPRGTNRLVGATALIRGNDGAAQHLAFDIIFSSRSAILGTQHATADGKVNPYSLGVLSFTANDYGGQSLDVMSVAMARDNRSNLCLTGDPDYSGNIGDPGFDRIYVGGLAGGAFDFSSNVTTTTTGTGNTVFAINSTTVAGLMLAEGDTIAAHDGASIGTIKSIDSDTQITLEAANTAAIASGDRIYPVSPITLILHFER